MVNNHPGLLFSPIKLSGFPPSWVQATLEIFPSEDRLIFMHFFATLLLMSFTAAYFQLRNVLAAWNQCRVSGARSVSYQ